MKSHTTILAVTVTLLLAVPAQAGTVLSMKTARAQANKIMARERANVYNARDLIGGDFTVKFNRCKRPEAGMSSVSCTYWIDGVQPVDPNASPLKYKHCVGGAEVRKNTNGKVFSYRWAAKRCPTIEH